MRSTGPSALLAALLAGCVGDGGQAAADAHQPELDLEPASTIASVQPLAELGEPTPTFELPTADGATVALEELRGSVVVLEWFNPECPFVRYAHAEGGVSELAAALAERGVRWLAINSSAPERPGNGVELNLAAAQEWTLPFPVLIDESGEVGRTYDALRTPTYFVIDRAGVLVYRGALDNARFGKVEGGGRVAGYVAAAVESALAGRPAATPETLAYGCRVQYGTSGGASGEESTER